MRLPLVLFLLAPLIEIASLIWVGQFIGILATLGLILLSGVLGIVLLRSQGLAILKRLQSETSQGLDPGRELVHGALIVVAAILLIVPGLVSDVLGILMFLPPVRDIVWRYVKPRIVVQSAGFARGYPQQPRAGNVVDLDADEYSHEPNPDTPWRGPQIGKD